MFQTSTCIITVSFITYYRVMIKTREDKKDDLLYTSFFCQVCNSEMLRTIENKLSDYVSPALLLTCQNCETRHFLRYDVGGVKFEIVSLKRGEIKMKI